MSTQRSTRAVREKPRHEVQRMRDRASYEREHAYAILDAGFVAHVGFANGPQPFVIPMLYARDGDRLLLHGAVASRLQRSLGAGLDCCVTVTHLDGLVLARSHFHHSVNYRSMVLFGCATPILDVAAKRAALAKLVEFVLPGRAADSRPPDRKELAATSVLALPIDEFSAKTRAAGVGDRESDLGLPVWAGVIPLTLQCGAAQPDPACNSARPAYVDRVIERGIGRR